MGLKTNKATDYAIRAMIHLACVPEGAYTMRDEIAETERIPSSFMAKILRSLVRNRLLLSARGVNGGFVLARPAEQITMLDIVEALEGPLQLAACSTCDRLACCPAASVWSLVQAEIERILGATTLEALVSAPRRKGRVELKLLNLLEAREAPAPLVKVEGG